MNTNPLKSYRLQDIRIRPIVLIIAVLGLVFAALLFQRLHRTPSVRLPAGGSDPCDMVLIGVRPDYDDELYSPEGHYLRYFPSATIKHPIWDEDRLQREFIFEIPVPNNKLFKIIKPIRIYLNGHRGYSVSPDIVEIKNGPNIRLVCSVGLPRLSLNSKSMITQIRGGEPVRTVDIEANYYASPVNRTDVRFTGPFVPNQRYHDDNGLGYSLLGRHLRISPDSYQLELLVTAALDLPFDAKMLIFRADDTWKIHRAISTRSTQETVTQRFLLRDTNIEQLTQITFNEPIHTRNFRNVVINYPQRSKRSHAPFLDHLAHAFSLPTNDMASVRELLTHQQWDNLDATLTFLPHGRGKSLQIALQTLFNNLTIDQLNPATSQALRQAAQTWIGTELEPSALALGTWAQWPEFASPALERLKWTPFDRKSEWIWARSYDFHTQPSDIEIQAVADVLAQRMICHRETRHHLIDFLRHQVHNPTGQVALLDLAQGNHPWIWSHLIVNDDLFATMTEDHPIPTLIKQRALALDVTVPGAPTENPDTQAYASITSWLTPALAQYDPNQFARITQALANHGDPQRDTPQLAQYLVDQLNQWSLYQLGKNLTDNYIAVQKAVILLNQWHDLNLGGLGQNLTIAWEHSSGYWQEIARSAITWAETRQNPMELAPNDDIDPNDIRLIWYHHKDPEQSVILLWSPAPLASEKFDCFSWTDRQGTFRCMIHPYMDYKRLKLSLYGPPEFPTPVITYMYPGQLHPPIDLRQTEPNLPGQDIDTPLPYSLIWEKATAQESILAGTTLYHQWQHRVLNPSSHDQPRPRVFSVD